MATEGVFYLFLNVFSFSACCSRTRRRSAMCDVYRVSSSVKVEQMEAELSRQLSALRVEIEENGLPQGAEPSKSYRCGNLVMGTIIYCVLCEFGLKRY